MSGLNIMVKMVHRFGGDHFLVHTDVKLTCQNPEIYKMLYTNFTSIKNTNEK